MEKIKLEVSKALKELNKCYCRNYTLNDIANQIGVSRETLSRITTDSSFRTIYAITECLYQFYPEYNDLNWNFAAYCMLMSQDNSFLI